MSRDKLSTPVWLLQGLFKSTPGTLELTQSRLVFRSEGEQSFDASRDSLTDISFPWYYFGAGIVFSIDSKRYRLSFVEPGEDGSITEGRAAGKIWKERLSDLTNGE